MLLLADIPRVLGRVAVLLPGTDPAEFLASNPRAVLDMDEAGLESSEEAGKI